MGSDVARDALEDLPSVVDGGFDDEGDVGTIGHWLLKKRRFVRRGIAPTRVQSGIELNLIVEFPRGRCLFGLKNRINLEIWGRN